MSALNSFRLVHPTYPLPSLPPLLDSPALPFLTAHSATRPNRSACSPSGLLGLTQYEVILFADLDVDLTPPGWELWRGAWLSALLQFARGSGGGARAKFGTDGANSATTAGGGTTLNSSAPGDGGGALFAAAPDHSAPINAGVWVLRPRRWLHWSALTLLCTANWSAELGFDGVTSPHQLAQRSSLIRQLACGMGQSVRRAGQRLNSTEHIKRNTWDFVTGALDQVSDCFTAALQTSPTAALHTSPTAALQTSPTAALQTSPTAALQPSSTAALHTSPTAALQPSSTAALQPSSTAALQPSSTAALQPSSTAALQPSSTASLAESGNHIFRASSGTCYTPTLEWAHGPPPRPLRASPPSLTTGGVLASPGIHSRGEVESTLGQTRCACASSLTCGGWCRSCPLRLRTPSALLA